MRGNITRRGKHSWRLKFDTASDGGKRVTRYVTFKGKRDDAEKELTRLLGEADKGMLADPSAITVREYLAQWLDGRRDDLSALTAQRYGETITRMINPFLGAQRLQQLKPAHVKQWLIDVRQGRRGERSARTILIAYNLLHGALLAAVKLDMVPRAVTANVDPPKAKAPKVAILKRDEIATVLDALEDSRLHPIACLAVATGLRRSELLALRWADIDLARATIRVERALEQTKGSITVKAPKTEAGVRKLSLPASAVAVLQAHRKEQLEQRLQLGLGKHDPDSLVFSNIDGSPISPNYFSILWARELKRYGLPKRTFHSLRHSHASALIRAGLDVVRVSRRLGHSKPTITLGTYAHEFEEIDTDAAEAIEGVLAKGRRP